MGGAALCLLQLSSHPVIGFSNITDMVAAVGCCFMTGRLRRPKFGASVDVQYLHIQFTSVRLVVCLAATVFGVEFE